MTTPVCVTQDDVEYSRRMLEQYGDGARAYCCPNAVAISRVLGINPDVNAMTHRVEVERKTVRVYGAPVPTLRPLSISALPDDARRVIHWFDLDAPEPDWPVCYELDFEARP